jgi:serine peptidase DegS
MKKITELLDFVVRAIVSGLAIAFLVVYLWPSLLNRSQQMEHTGVEATQEEGSASAVPLSYADAVNRAAPAVVSIYTSSLDPQPVTPEVQQELGDRYLYRMRRDMGSGVLVSEDGYVLTNHHVVSGAQNIKIALWDGRLASAEVVGSDPETDLAVLKVNLTGLPTVPIAHDPPPRVGDVVLAIGNALGLSHTVTMGIISATGRDNIGSPSADGFLQTDAAINAGNSGGALVNARGELIGISARNLGSIQGAQNIGFAIPMGIAQNVMQQIIDYGSVRRGWLGVQFSNIPSSSRSRSSPSGDGAHVRSVARGGPAWIAGIREGDTLLKLNGQPIHDIRAFNLLISSTLPGTKVDIDVERGSRVFTTYAILIQQPPIPAD